ncbi:hypothetical protein, partial [Sphingomonas azotifigens]|uniref:hypothetical protein n=1 Tax=Sphingomonas azotifigens TaxID=330920 RepID=UPI001C3FB464
PRAFRLFPLCSIITAFPSRQKEPDMSIKIEPLENGRLKLSSDVEDEICLSARALDEGFAIATSDGTLVQGRVDNWVDECRFSVAVEGAGIATISRAERGDVLDLAWKVEWISVAIARDMRCAERSEAPQMQRELSFIDAGKIAA